MNFYITGVFFFLQKFTCIDLQKDLYIPPERYICRYITNITIHISKNICTYTYNLQRSLVNFLIPSKRD